MRLGQIVIDVAPLRESRDFRRLYSGRLAASAGSMITTTAASWQVYALTRSPLDVGLLTLITSIGGLVSQLTGGMPATTGGPCCSRQDCRKRCWQAR
jgi:MFS transporter, ENTS family, enterobactin (siderophore) exporter